MQPSAAVGGLSRARVMRLAALWALGCACLAAPLRAQAPARGEVSLATLLSGKAASADPSLAEIAQALLELRARPRASLAQDALAQVEAALVAARKAQAAGAAGSASLTLAKQRAWAALSVADRLLARADAQAALREAEVRLARAQSDAALAQRALEYARAHAQPAALPAVAAEPSPAAGSSD
jgi:hypothetical protein